MFSASLLLANVNSRLRSL